MTTQQDVIKQFMASLDKTTLEGTAALDEAIKACSNFNGIQDAIDHMVEDCKNSSSGEYFLRKYCGINLLNDDTGAISGSDAGGDKVKNAEDIVPESGEAVYPTSNTFTVRGLTVVLPDKSTLTKAEQRIVKGLYSWWIDSALKLIEESYGFSFTDSDKSDNTLYVNFNYEPSSWYLAWANGQSLTINMDRYRKIVDGDVNGSYGDSGFYHDRIVSHELTHSIMDVAISSFWTLPEFITEGMAELTHGSDDGRNYYIKSLAENPQRLAEILNINHFGTGEDMYYAGGFMFLRYLARQGAGVTEEPDLNIVELSSKNDYYHVEKDGLTIIPNGGNDHIYFGNLLPENTTIKIDNADIIDYDADLYSISIKTSTGSIYLSFNDSGSKPNIIDKFDNKFEIDDRKDIRNENDNIILNGGKNQDIIYSTGKNVTINGDNGNDEIYSGEGNIANGGAGNDYLEALEKNVTLNGGTDDDTFYINENTTIIYNAGDGNDIISTYYNRNNSINIIINGGKVDSYEVKGFDVILKIGEGSIKIYEGAGQEIKINGITHVYGHKPDIFNDSGTSGNDYIYDDRGYVKINGYSGDDCIVVKGRSTVDGGTGNDTIDMTHAYESTFEYTNGDGDDVVIGFKYYDTLHLVDTSITGSSINGNDVLVSVGNNILTFKNAVSYIGTINVINADGQLSSISASNYNDLEGSIIRFGNDGTDFSNYANDSTIIGGGGNDTIYCRITDGGSGLINAGLGDDSIQVYGNEVIVEYKAGDGADTIHGGTLKFIDTEITGYSFDEYDLKLQLGENEIIIEDGRYEPVRIKDKSDNLIYYHFGNRGDEIKENGTTHKYYKANGYFLNYGSDVTLELLNAGFIDSGGANATLIGSSDNDTIYNITQINFNSDYSESTICSGSGAMIYSNDGNDLILNHFDKVFINAGNGNDTIQNLYQPQHEEIFIGVYEVIDYIDNLHTTIDAGAGDDEIINDNSTAIIKAGEGNDNIYNNGQNVTIEAGKGNDTITVSNDGAALIIYNAGDDDDTIAGYSINDTIKIINGSIDSVLYEDYDVFYDGYEDNRQDIILKIGEGSIRFLDVKDKQINVQDSDGKIKTYKHRDYTTKNVNGINVVNFTQSVSWKGSSEVDSVTTIVDNVTIDADGGNDFIYNYSGNSLIDAGDGDDYIVSNGRCATINAGNGADSINNSNEGVLINGGDGDDFIEDSGTAGTIIGGKGDDFINNASHWETGKVFKYSEGDGNDQILAPGLSDTIEIDGTVDINNIYKTSYQGRNYVTLYIGSGSISLQHVWANIGENRIHIKDNTGDITSKVYGADPNDTLDSTDPNSNDDYGDSTLPSDNDTLPAETISGGDDTLLAETIPAGQIYNGTKKTDLLIGGDGDDTLIGGKGKDNLTGGNGKDFFIYANGDGNDIITDYTSGEDVIKLTSGSIKGSSLSGSDVILKIGSGSIKLKDTKNKEIKIIDSKNKTSTLIYGSTSKDTINGTSNADSLYGDKGNDVIKGNAGADTLVGGKGNDTLTGGKGNDFFAYSSGDGNDVIADYNTGDKIKLLSGSINSASISGSDVVLKIGNGSIKIKSGKKKAINIVDSKNKGTNLIYGSTSKETLKGTTGADSIYGNSGNDTLIGGKGADTLVGGAGKDVFVYSSGDGKDIITDYTAKQDKIKLTSGSITSSSIKGSDVVLKIGSGSITVKDGKGKSITVVDSKGKSTSRVYGTSKKNYWFTEDDNIITSEVDSIINNDSKLIGNDYNYDINSTFTKQLNQTLATNLTKPKIK